MVEDKSCLICEMCYKDFKDMFNWKLIDTHDDVHCPHCGNLLNDYLTQDYVFICDNCNIIYSEDLLEEID